jgi:hypothetical protein
MLPDLFARKSKEKDKLCSSPFWMIKLVIWSKKRQFNFVRKFCSEATCRYRNGIPLGGGWMSVQQR